MLPRYKIFKFAVYRMVPATRDALRIETSAIGYQPWYNFKQYVIIYYFAGDNGVATV